MGICNSKKQKLSQIYSQQSTTLSTIIPIIHNKKNNKKQKKIRFCDVEIEQKQILTDPKSLSPPPKIFYNSSNYGYNKDILFGQLRTPKEKFSQITKGIQSKQTLFGKKLRFSNSIKKGQRI